MPSSGNTPYITLLGLVLLWSNGIVSKFHCSSVIILRYLRKGTWQGPFGGRRRSFLLPRTTTPGFLLEANSVSAPACQSVSTLTTCCSCHLLLRLRYGWGKWPRALSRLLCLGLRSQTFWVLWNLILYSHKDVKWKYTQLPSSPAARGLVLHLRCSQVTVLGLAEALRLKTLAMAS